MRTDIHSTLRAIQAIKRDNLRSGAYYQTTMGALREHRHGQASHYYDDSELHEWTIVLRDGTEVPVVLSGWGGLERGFGRGSFDSPGAARQAHARPLPGPWHPVCGCVVIFHWARASRGHYRAHTGHHVLEVWADAGAWHGSIDGRLVTGAGCPRKADAQRTCAYWNLVTTNNERGNAA